MSARFVFHDAFAAGEATFDQVRVLSTQGERVKLRFITADDRAVEATGNPIALARALVKIERAATPG